MEKVLLRIAIMAIVSLYTLQANAQYPVVTDFSPKIGRTGTHVTITGSNFTNADQVGFGMFIIPAASFSIISDTQIDAVIGTGASSYVYVHNAAGWGYADGFLFSQEPHITGCTPQSGPVGTTVTISGTDFSTAGTDNSVYFGTVKAVVTQSSSTELKVVVPSGADNHLLSVTSHGLTATAAQAFTVKFPAASTEFLAGSFDPVITLSTGEAPEGFVAADIDGDGKTDLLVSNASAKGIDILRNTGSKGIISFAAQQDFILPEAPLTIAVGDLNGDGKPDIVGCGAINLYYRLNSSTGGNISFEPAQLVNPGYGPNKIRILDFNGDGRQDILLNNYAQAFIILNIPNSDTTFTLVPQNVERLPDYTGTPGFDFYDLDGDRKPEMAVNSPLNSLVNVFPNTSTPTSIDASMPYQLYQTGKAPMDGVAFADVDGDGKMDIVTANKGDGTVGVLMNMGISGNILFSNTQTLFTAGAAPSHIVMADMNGDGTPDAIISDNPDGHGTSVNVLRNESIPGTLNLQLPGMYTTGEGPSEVICADLDNDGKLDIAVANTTANTISLFRNRINEPDVLPSGTHPLTGRVSNDVFMDSAVQEYNGEPFVQRHYEITPVSNAPTATATITLYFSQTDFDNFNAYTRAEPFLPFNGSDAAHISNIRVYQYHGFSATGDPGSYGSPAIVIDPDDDKIIWDPIAYCWKITFDVNGFSGFFLGNNVNVSLPLTLLSFSGKHINKGNLLTWTTADAVNVNRFNPERSVDGVHFSTIGSVIFSSNVSGYQFTDAALSSPDYYYRLKIVNNDDKYSLSKIIFVSSSSAGQNVVYPNPVSANSIFTFMHPVQEKEASIEMHDVTGKCLRTIKVPAGNASTIIDTRGFTAGTYLVVWKGQKTFSIPLVLY